MKRVAGLFAGLIVGAVPVHAAECRLSTTGLHFGTLNPRSADSVTSLGTLVMSCQGRTGELIHYRLRLTTGEGQYRLRLMHSGAAVLAYNLYLDAGRTQVWGDGSEGTTQASGTLRLTSPSYSGVYPVYARILSTAATAATAYADSIVVQLSY